MKKDFITKFYQVDQMKEHKMGST